jgi:hypothetical protein
MVYPSPPMIISYKKNFFVKVCEFTKTGMTLKKAWEACEDLHQIEVGENKYCSFESFECGYYNYVKSEMKKGLGHANRDL